MRIHLTNQKSRQVYNKDQSIGRPKSRHYTTEQLEAWGLVGLYEKLFPYLWRIISQKWRNREDISAKD